MKTRISLIMAILFIFTSICFAGPRQMAEISLGGMMFKDKIQVFTMQDPDMPFITIYLSTIKSGNPMALADPSNNCVSTRLTRKIGTIVKTVNAEVINLKKSVGWKSLKLARFYDEPNKTMVYVTYSTKVFEGSYKHTISTVPLGEYR